MVSSEYKAVVKKIDILQRTVDRMIEDMATDRKDNGELIVRVGAIYTAVDNLINAHNIQAKKIEDKVEDALDGVTDPVIKEVKGLRRLLKNKNITVINPFTSFFRFSRGVKQK